MILRLTAILVFLLASKCHSQSYFNEMFILDTSIVLKVREFGTSNIFDFVATSDKNQIIFTDYTRMMKKNDTIPFLIYSIEQKTLDKLFVITNNNDAFASKYSTIRNIAYHNDYLFITSFEKIFLFRKNNNNFYFEESIGFNSNNIIITNDTVLVCTKTNNPTSHYLIYDFENRKIIEENSFQLDVLGMAHIAPFKYIDAYNNHLYFINANQYTVVKYNFYTHQSETIIEHNPKKWKSLSNTDIKKINEARPGAPAIKVLQELLPKKNVIHGLEVINDSTIFIRHLYDYYGKNMEFYVDMWELKNDDWVLSSSNLKYKKPCNPSKIITKDNYPIYLYNSFFHNKNCLFFTIEMKETEISPIGYYYEDFFTKNQNELITKKPVFKLNIFVRNEKNN